MLTLIEAKAPGADLRSHVTQVLGYAFHDGVDICVLTTGLEWWLFLPREKNEPMERRFAVLDLLNDSVERLAEDLRAFLHKVKLVSGEAENKAKQVLIANREAAKLRREIPAIWNRMLEQPDEELVELIGSRVYEKLNLRPDKGQIVAALRGKPIPPELDPAPAGAAKKPKVPSSRDETANKPKRSPRQSAKPVAIMLWGVRYPVAKHKDVLGRVVDCLHERHEHDNFDRILELRGRKKPYAALTSDGMRAHHRISTSRYFVDGHGNAEALRRRAELFLATFGYDKSDLEVLFE
ncbi:MAG: hypothetical protein OXH78_03190 [Acidimicrobiaceae bacterium]|nr:hypothetical protein [Acidimicrobiaceae bacterium]